MLKLTYCRLSTTPTPKKCTSTTRDLCAIAKSFSKEYSKYSQWSDKDRKELLREFLRRYKWAPNANAKFCKSKFNAAASDRMRNAMWDARRSAKRKLGQNISDWYASEENLRKTMPKWAKLPQWEALCRQWDMPSFKNQSMQNKRNRASGSSTSKGTYCGGSRSQCDTRKDMEIELGRDVPYMEVYKKTETKKSTGGYIDIKSALVQENYCRAMTEIRGENWKDDPKEWLRVAGGYAHGGLYGVGSLIDTRTLDEEPESSTTRERS